MRKEYNEHSYFGRCDLIKLREHSWLAFALCYFIYSIVLPVSILADKIFTKHR